MSGFFKICLIPTACLLLGLGFIHEVAIGQTVTDSLALRSESQRLGINTFSGTTAFDWRNSATSKHRLWTQSGHYWVYNKALPAKPFIIQNLYNAAGHATRIGKYLNWENQLVQRSFFANETRMAQALTYLSSGIQVPSGGELFLVAGAGWVNDKRAQFDDYGPRVLARAYYLTKIADSTLSLSVRSEWMQTYIWPRRNDRLESVASLQKEFGPGSFVELQGGQIKSKVEDYIGKDIQSIQSDTALARIKVRYPIWERWVLLTENQLQTPNRLFIYKSIETKVESRNVRYFQDDYQSTNSLQYVGRRFKANLMAEYKVRNRSYDIINRLDAKSPTYSQDLFLHNQRLREERIKDIREQYTTYTTDFRWQMSQRHSLTFNSVAQLLRVDTRSDLNNQDRDEILYSSEVRHDWKVFSNFKLINKVSSSYRHLVFIEASQSSENFVDRILRWEPGYRWQSGRLFWQGNLGIWATYQVRDFENQQDKNRSNRVLILQQQLEARLAQNLKLLGDALRRENRLSQLNWKRFSESPIDTVTIHDVSLRLQYSSNTGKHQFSIQSGYRAFWQIRKAKASLSDPNLGSKLIFLRTIIVQQGPQIQLAWTRGFRFKASLDVWMQWSSQYYRYKQSTEVFLGNSFSPEQLNTRDNRFLPFFNGSLFWYFGKN